MPKTLVVTSYNHRLYEDYAHRFLDTYKGELDLAIVSEDQLPTLSNTQTLHMTAHTNFVKQNSWRTPTSFKQDAVRFCHKPYAIWTAMQHIHSLEYNPYTGLLWLDADTVFHKPLTEELIQERLYTEHTYTYMGRPNYHSETGVLWFNTENKNSRDYVNLVVELYNTNDIYKLDETHDSYVWDWVRTKRKIRARDIGISERVPGGHIQARLFGEWFDHLKGKRKQQGYSQENAYVKR